MAAVSQSLSPPGAQLVFRAALDALARPGTIHRLPSASAEPLAARVPAALLPVLALADLTTPTCVLADGDRWDEVVRVATAAPSASLAEASLVSVLRPLADGELASLRTGAATAPENGALACLAVASIGTAGGRGQVLRLTGPGVPGTRDLLVAGLPNDFVTCRRRLAGGFPAGVDLLLISPEGAMTGLPRTTVICEEAA
jgi:alpha-D-ribose 1-methylphosphonate 5-triphosphate synthase subunit PhnH